MKVLITGGAGYIGSSVAWMFIDKGHDVTIIDNLIRGKVSNLPKKSKFIKSDIADIDKLKKLLDKKYDVVLHFAALIDNEESLSKKKLYFENNFYKSKIFLNLCIDKGIKNFIFSSSAAVYGASKKSVNENFKTKPLAPYGESKLKFEKLLKKSKKKINYVVLRYFNVVGAEKKMRCGFEIKKNKSLFNNLCKAFVNKKKFFIFGKNFDTPDGTSVRDYVHINDISKVHYKFAKIIRNKKINLIINCGYGTGYSVLDVIRKFNYIYRRKIDFQFKEKRINDIEYSVASTKRLQRFQNLKESKNKLTSMIKSSLIWYKKSLKK